MSECSQTAPPLLRREKENGKKNPNDQEVLEVVPVPENEEVLPEKAPEEAEKAAELPEKPPDEPEIEKTPEVEND